MQPITFAKSTDSKVASSEIITAGKQPALANLLRLRSLTTPARIASPVASATMLDAADPATSRIVLVEWRIEKGREQAFLDYWSKQATVRDRSGLVGEFLSQAESGDKFPWTAWEVDPRWTTFVNVGIWRSGNDFEQQIGRYIDQSRPLDFEAAPRRRLFVMPERWRIGASQVVAMDHPEVR